MYTVVFFFFFFKFVMEIVTFVKDGMRRMCLYIYIYICLYNLLCSSARFLLLNEWGIGSGTDFC